jgi:hypothetical protein
LLNVSTGGKFEDISRAVAALHRKHGRELPPPVTGTITLTEPPDTFR